MLIGMGLTTAMYEIRDWFNRRIASEAERGATPIAVADQKPGAQVGANSCGQESSGVSNDSANNGRPSYSYTELIEIIKNADSNYDFQKIGFHIQEEQKRYSHEELEYITQFYRYKRRDVLGY